MVVNCRTSGPLPNRIDQIVNVEGSANTFVIDKGNYTNAGGMLKVTNAPGMSARGINGEVFLGGSAASNGSAAVWLKQPDAWANATTYDVGDLTTVAGVSYRSLSAHTSSEATNEPGSGSAWFDFWAVHDPFENVHIEGNLISVAGSFDGNALVRIDTGENVTVIGNRMGVGLGGVRAFSVGAAAVNADLRGNTYPPGFPQDNWVTNTPKNVKIDTYGTVTQSTSKSTGFFFNRASGVITTSNSSLAAGAVASFEMVNTYIGPEDVVMVSQRPGATIGAYLVSTLVLDGVAIISLRNMTAGALAEAVILSFKVLKD